MEDRATQFCLLEHRGSTLLPSLNLFPEVDFLPDLSPAVSELQNAVSIGGLLLSMIRLRCSVVFRYRITFSIAFQSSSLGFAFRLPNILTVAEMSGLVKVATYNKDPTAFL